MTHHHVSPRELMLRDTMLELLDELRAAPAEDAFDKGYRQGMARALDVLKYQARAYNIESSVGLSDFRYEEWIG